MAQQSLTTANEAQAAPGAAWNRWDERLDRWSEWLNPILVKEARQAFKSNQFLVTFLLLLTFGWGWSLLGVVIQMPGVQFGAGGTYLLGGYFLILIVPLLVVVPFSAFRSLAAEREDGTFEILSITTLSARQIVTGKLGSAVLQMLVYYSAISPCIAFTYLLRGIDIVTIGIILFYSFAMSLILSCVSLMAATLTRSRHWQVLLSVALILGLAAATIIWAIFVFNALLDPMWSGMAEQTEFWTVNLCLVTVVIAICTLCISAARGLISFASDNRSGPLRRIMLGHQVAFLFWVTYGLVYAPEPEYLEVVASFAAVYWMVAGSLMVGEAPYLSPRVRRELPQSLLGRMFLTWFNPGSGTGYMFAVVNLGVIVVFLITAGFVSSLYSGARIRNDFKWISYIGLAWCYVAAYLGVSRLILVGIRSYLRPNMALSLALNIVLPLGGAVVPFLLESALHGFQSIDYTPLQITNWIWTLYVAADELIWDYPLVPVVVMLFAGAMVLLQMLTMGTELWQDRIAVPQRVLDDDRQLQPPPQHEPERAGPWD